MSLSENLTKEVSDIYKKLSEKLPENAIQRTRKEDTKKSYDTDGYGYMFCVNRLNDILGNQWGYEYKIIRESTGTFKSGTPYFDITIETSVWVLSPSNTRSMVGGHISSNYADAVKGAFTNSFKKTVAMWGVGRHAYEGTMDDDNESPEKIKEEKTKKDVKVQDAKEPEKPKTEEPKKEERKEPASVETKTLLNFDGLIQKMATSKNKFELNARCKKYKPDYNELDQEHQKFVIIERDKRILWLTKGEGIYEDEATRGIDKDRGNEVGK